MTTIIKDNIKSLTIEFRSKDELLDRLSAAGILGKSPETDLFYRDFIDSITARPKDPFGVVMAWELSKSTLRGCGNAVLSIDASFCDVINMITEDVSSASAIIELRKHAITE